MAKITHLEQKTFQGKPSGFKVTLDDGTSGNLQEKESDKGLRVGDDVIVTLIPYTSKAGVTSNLIGLRLANTAGTTVKTSAPTPQAQRPTTPPYSAPKATGKTKEELKSEAAIRIMEVFLSAFFDAKIESGKIAEDHKEYVQLVWAEIDDAFSSK